MEEKKVAIYVLLFSLPKSEEAVVLEKHNVHLMHSTHSSKCCF